MKKLVLIYLLLSITTFSFSQVKVSGYLYSGDKSNRLPYVHVLNKASGNLSTTDDHGRFIVSGSPKDSIKFSAIGFKEQILTIQTIENNPEIALIEGVLALEGVTVTTAEEVDPGIQKLDKINLKLIPVNNAQDLLRTVSGLFIAQHAGGGKAEQIFLRGFDNDHGTDFAAFIDDIPVNFSNHAHGQGYADMHFIIPELIWDGDYYKGPYELKNGNFSVSGAARYKTRNNLEKNEIKFDVGQYGFQRGLLMLNLIPENQLIGKTHQNAYLAVEGVLNKGFFKSSQDFEKFNAFFKYNLSLSKNTSLQLSSSHFTSDWNASGQIPLRAVENGTIDRFGAIDDTEGGSTARTNLSVNFNTFWENDQYLRHFAYYGKNKYTLYSNFTFFLNDRENGDMIAQDEDRDFFGYLTEYERKDFIGDTELKTTLSAGFRSDEIQSGLKTAIRREIIESINNNKVRETNYWAYIKGQWRFNDKTLLEFGTRWDAFDFNINGNIEGGSNTTSGSRTSHRWSPKASFFYNPIRNIRLFAKAGMGFHSNYAHAAITDTNTHPLPRAKAIDVGVEVKLGNKLIANAAFWSIKSDAEYIFVVDAGAFENNGPSKRHGVDIAAKYQPYPSLWFDWSANVSTGELSSEPEGANSIPSAPRFTSTGSVTYHRNNGLGFLLSYRYMARRPLTEDESVFAGSYFLVDGTINYTRPKFQIGISVQNLFDQQWMEAVFYDASQLLDELESVDDFHFTPGTPFFLKGTVSYFF